MGGRGMAKVADKVSGIADIVSGSQDKDGMLRRALERIIQLYTDKSHFIYELLQNAEDAGASRIKFEQYADKLIVLHDGHPFSLDNLKGLCDIGKSDKTNDLNQIGEFGVGFKSVFGICESVKLFSHPTRKDLDKGYSRFAVEILNFTHPVDIEDEDIALGYTTKFIFPYSVGFTFSSFQAVDQLNEVLSKRLQNLGITTLLFMKNLKSIDYMIDLPNLKTSGYYTLDKTVINDHCALVSAIGETGSKKDNEERVSYLVFSRPVTGIQTGRTIDIAFALNVKEDGKYDFKPSKYPYISVYFPTETESKLKFIVQGPYRTTPNRSSVPADSTDNMELAEQTAALLRDSVVELRDTGKLDFSLLNILPIDKDAFYSAPLFEGMFETTSKMMQEENLLLCKDGSYASADCVKIARGSDFAELFTDELLTELIDDGTDYHWLPTFLTETNKTYKTLYDFLTDTLHIEVIRLENLRDNFNENQKFLLNRNDEWLIKMYNMYASVAAAFSKKKRVNMLTVEFVKTSTGKFVAPYRLKDGSSSDYDFMSEEDEDSPYLPNVFLPSEDIDDSADLAFVDGHIYESCRYFFNETLHLKKPDEYEFFIRDFKRRYEQGKNFTEDQHIKDVKKLLEYMLHKEHRDEVNALIRKYLLLRCTKDGEKVYINPYEETVFFSVTEDGMSIEQYYSHVASYAYVDVDFYVTNNGISREELRNLGVQENIARNEEIIAGTCDTGNPGRKPHWNTKGDFRLKLTLDKLDEVLEYISRHPEASDSKAKSSFIYRFLVKNVNRLQGDVYLGVQKQDRHGVYCEMVERLRMNGSKQLSSGSEWNGRWLYTESCEWVAPGEVTKRDLNTVFYGNILSDSTLYEILGFKKDPREEAVKNYDNLPGELKKQYLEIALQRRYGISISDLEDRFGKNGGNIIGPVIEDDSYEFPSAKIKNWGSLRKHAAEVLCFASPIRYEYKVRKIRMSKPADEIRAYLKNMYKVDRAYKYACQMCHEAFPNPEMCQIAKSPDVELDSMNLCLCPNCAAEYKRMRNDESGLKDFLEKIDHLSEVEIGSADPVEIEFGNKMIWFTQAHIGEIRELRSLKQEADKFKNVIITPKPIDNSPDTDVYKDYKDCIGKRIRHKSEGYGTVKICDGTYIGIEFETGPKAGLVTKYVLETCLTKGIIEFV